jgi:hypothetical protein
VPPGGCKTDTDGQTSETPGGNLPGFEALWAGPIRGCRKARSDEKCLDEASNGFVEVIQLQDYE